MAKWRVVGSKLYIEDTAQFLDKIIQSMTPDNSRKERKTARLILLFNSFNLFNPALAGACRRVVAGKGVKHKIT